MNKKLILNLFASSSIFTSLISTLGIINPAHASTALRKSKVKIKSNMESAFGRLRMVH
jgi:hypothetical protein